MNGGVSEGTRQKQIMVVDDQPANLKLMEAILGRLGYAVHSFPRGRLALAAAAVNPPDLILLDVSMPEMGGYEVCKKLQADTALSKIPVIFLSGRAETEDKVAGFQAGGVDYVTKPFNAEEIKARIETQLRLHDLQRKVEGQNRELGCLVQEQIREITEGQMATIFALAKLADSRDNETGKHLERVQALCKVLAEEMGAWPKYAAIIDAEYARNIFEASPLHDIGKVAIPDSILLKPGALTVEEFAVMKTHTVRGSETLELVLGKYPQNAFVRLGIEIARSHHERWDGAGYPDGLAGPAIPLSARIMAVADCYDALRSERYYKAAHSHAESCEIITRESGRHFDPDVVRAFSSVESTFRQIRDSIA
jgi:putative two-component system response regulator